MPPRINSRHSFTTAQLNADGIEYLSDRIPFRYRAFDDNGSHVVKDGDTLWNIASRYYSSLGRLPEYSAAQLWWVIADFQPTPIHDPTIKLAEGQVLIIPSVSTVLNYILAPPDTRV